MEVKLHRNPSPAEKRGLRFPLPRPIRAPKRRVHALTPFERAQRVFMERLAPIGCRIEFGPKEEGGVFITMPSIDLSDYGPTLEDAIQNFVESAREVALMRKAPGESWTKALEAQHRLLKKALA
jgi:hypothetical protein